MQELNKDLSTKYGLLADLPSCNKRGTCGITSTTPLVLKQRGLQGPGKLGQIPHTPEKSLHPSSRHFHHVMR